MSLRGDLFPTDEMKIALANVYIDYLDLLRRLAKYFTLQSLSLYTPNGTFKYGILTLSSAQLVDAVFPRESYQFVKYSQTLKASISILQELCDRGQIAKQEDTREMTMDIAHCMLIQQN